MGFGARLRQTYVAMGFNRASFARKIGKQYHQVVSWENGTIPEPENLNLLADATGRSIDWLLNGDAPIEGSRVELENLDPVIEKVIAEGDWTPDEIDALRRTNWKLLASTNYNEAFVLDTMLRRRKPAAAVKATLPENVARRPSSKKKGSK